MEIALRHDGVEVVTREPVRALERVSVEVFAACGGFGVADTVARALEARHELRGVAAVEEWVLRHGLLDSPPSCAAAITLPVREMQGASKQY